jgi:hypothetical protein
VSARIANECLVFTQICHSSCHQGRHVQTTIRTCGWRNV